MTEQPLDTAQIRSRITEIKTVRFGDVLPHPRNPKIHPQNQREAFRGAVRELGFVSVPLAYHSERTGGLTWADGHLRGSEVADYVGEVAILDIDDIEADYMLVTADPIAAMATADAAALDALLRDVNSSSAAVMDMLAELAEGAGLYPEPTTGAGGDEFDATPQEGDTRAQRGDIWAMGEHKLLVDDCTIAANVARLMGGERAIAAITDPPYSVDYANQEREPGRVTRRMSGDTYSDPSNVGEFLKAFVSNLPTDVLVMTYPVNKHFHELSDATRDFEMLYECVWVKNHFAYIIGRRYQPKHEPILIFRRKNGKSTFNVPANQSTVFEYDKAAANPDHPTPRPVELVERLIEYHSDAGDVIFEPFCGSGTAVIAAQRQGRKCYALELMPQYADVILRRYEAESGKEAVLVERVNRD